MAQEADLARAERIFQLVAPDLPAEFPALRSLGAKRYEEHCAQCHVERGQGASSPNGAGLYNEGAVTLSNVQLTENAAYGDGGAIACAGGSFTAGGLTVSLNTAFGRAGWRSSQRSVQKRSIAFWKSLYAE